MLFTWLQQAACTGSAVNDEYSRVQGGQSMPIDLVVEERFHRAAPGGMGGTKAAGNYSPVLLTQRAAKVCLFLCCTYSPMLLAQQVAWEGPSFLLCLHLRAEWCEAGGGGGVVGCSGRGRLRCPRHAQPGP